MTEPSPEAQPGAQDDAGDYGAGFGAAVARFANWFNEAVVANPLTYLAAIVLVVGADLMIPVQGFAMWNLTTGLFFNTQSSNIELITGIGAVVAVCSARRILKQHRRETADRDAAHAREISDLNEAHHRHMAQLHAKFDALLGHHGVTAPQAGDGGPGMVVTGAGDPPGTAGGGTSAST
jgi:hypothetical protein